VTVLHFVSGTVLTINARNYFGNLLFANYYRILLYTLLWLLQILLGILQYAATPPPQRASNTFPCAFQTLTTLLKFYKYSPDYSRRISSAESGWSMCGCCTQHTPILVRHRHFARYKVLDTPVRHLTEHIQNTPWLWLCIVFAHRKIDIWRSNLPL